MALPPAVVYEPSKHKEILHSVSYIHMACITHDGTLATFLPPLSHEKVHGFWLEKSRQVEQGARAIILQFAPTPCGQQELAGVVTLDMPFSETGPFRCEAEKLLVSPRYRRKGVARALMEKLEDVGREKQRGLIFLGTTVGTGAEDVYLRLGYTCYGVVPKYGIDPRD